MILAANMAGQQAAPTLTPETAILPGLNQRTDTIRIDLEDSDLWTVFNTDLTNEMIITKNGRKIFPVIKLKIRGLDPNLMYSVRMEFQQHGQNRWKFSDGGWTHAGKAEPPPSAASYLHPRSPNYGRVWMGDLVDFTKIKVSNKCSKDMVRLNSLHYYEPRVRVFEVDRDGGPEILVAEKSLRICSFMAVTSYQNEEVTSLKVKHNPFAKGFQENRLKYRFNHDPVKLIAPDYENGLAGATNITPTGWTHPSQVPLSMGESCFGATKSMTVYPGSNSHAAHLSQRYNPYSRRTTTAREKEFDGPNQQQKFGNSAYASPFHSYPVSGSSASTTEYCSGASTVPEFSAVGAINSAVPKSENQLSCALPPYQYTFQTEQNYGSLYNSYATPPTYGYANFYNGNAFAGGDTFWHTNCSSNGTTNGSPTHPASPSSSNSSTELPVQRNDVVQ